MVRIYALLYLIVLIWAVIDVWNREQDMQKKLLWIVVIFLIPAIGAIAWFLVSRKIIKI